MIIREINISNYKNYKSETFTFHPRVNIIVGENGMGKTNLLDALYYTCLGKSYFTRSDKNVVRHEEKWFRLEAVCSENDAKEKIEIVYKSDARKKIVVSGKTLKKLSHYIGRFPAVMIAPMDIQILLEGSENRRAFIDNTNIQIDPIYLNNLINYTKVLKQRNAYVKHGAEIGFFDHNLIDAFNHGLIEPAKYIHLTRDRSVRELSIYFEQFHNKLTKGKEKCELIYRSQLSSDSLHDLLKESLEKDKILGRTTCGIHKDDLKFIMNERELKTYASQGQLKSYVLALKLAQFEMLFEKNQKIPIFLLDDIFAKLDDQRVLNLIDLLLSNKKGQIFISDTSGNRLASILKSQNIDFKQFEIEEGRCA